MVTAHYIHVSVAHESPPITGLEKCFNSALDWYRYSDYSWVLYTTTDIDTWRDRIRKVRGMKMAEVIFFMCVFDPTVSKSYSGYMTKDFWDWLKESRSREPREEPVDRS